SVIAKDAIGFGHEHSPAPVGGDGRKTGVDGGSARHCVRLAAETDHHREGSLVPVWYPAKSESGTTKATLRWPLRSRSAGLQRFCKFCALSAGIAGAGF